jgi:putative acetyltransferase
MPELTITVDDPRTPDVRAMLERHLAFANETTPPEDVYALDLDGLLDPSVTLFAARPGNELVAIGALKELDAQHAELKSMHTLADQRGAGLGRAMVEHIVAVATARGCERISLETGSFEAFLPAQRLYASCGFTECGAFADYPEGPQRVFMERTLR